jgi:hypothetical protein
VKPCSVYGQHQQSSLTAQAFTQQEDKMAAKKIGKSKWIAWGRVPGIAIGISISKHYISIEVAFWYLTFEF